MVQPMRALVRLHLGVWGTPPAASLRRLTAVAQSLKSLNQSPLVDACFVVLSLLEHRHAMQESVTRIHRVTNIMSPIAGTHAADSG